MAERKFFDTEALLDTLFASASEIGLEFDVNFLLEKLEQNSADVLNDAILEVLKDNDFAADVEISYTNPPLKQRRGFGLRLHQKVRDGHTEKVAFYRVKESFKTGALSLVSLAAGLWMASPTIILSGTSLLLNAWRNLIILKYPRNKLEIVAYEALLRVQVRRMQESDIAYYYPSTREIHVETGNTSAKDTVLGLVRLRDLQLVEVKHWGNRPHDTASMRNLWYQTF